MEKPYTQITTDTTEFKYCEKDKSGNYQIKKLYLNPYLDMYNSEILSYEISKQPTLEPILKALDRAIKITNKSKRRKNISLRSRLVIPNKTIHIKTRRKWVHPIYVKKRELSR